MFGNITGKQLGYHILYYGLMAVLVTGLVTMYGGQPARAAACTPPAEDNGTVTYTVNVTEAGTYRVWTRMAAPNASDNTYLLEIDSSQCYEVGGSSVPVYSGSAAPYFVAGASNWVSRTASGTSIDVALTAGNHQMRLIGAHAGVVVDRVILTLDTVCSPSGTGDNCATDYLVVDINEDGSINYLDLSSMASSYEQSGGGVGRNDINQDGAVNYMDLSLLATHYEG